MRAIIKRPGEKARAIEVGGNVNELAQAIGGAYETIPALAGAMILCRALDMDLPDNFHFLGRHYKGSILIVGRGAGDMPVDIPGNLAKIIPLALGGRK